MTTSPRTRKRSRLDRGSARHVEDVEELVSGYPHDVILIAQGTVYRGRQGARQLVSRLQHDLRHARWELETVVKNEVAYVKWRAVGPADGGDGRRSGTMQGFVICPLRAFRSVSPVLNYAVSQLFDRQRSRRGCRLAASEGGMRSRPGARRSSPRLPSTRASRWTDRHSVRSRRRPVPIEAPATPHVPSAGLM